MTLMDLKNYCHLGMCSKTPGHCLSELRWKFFETGNVSQVVLKLMAVIFVVCELEYLRIPLSGF